MRARHYAEAIKSLIDSAPNEKTAERYIENAAKTILENGHGALVPRILRRLRSMIESDRKQKTITVVSADDVSESEVGALLKKEPFSTLLSGTHRYVERKKDPALVGGVVVRTRTMRADTSDKRALLDLYHHLTQ
jgi:F0F1-type ATP synthase delta subunit